MTKLYTVTYEVEYVIAVDDGVELLEVARDTFREALRDQDDPSGMFIYPMESLPDGWNEDCYPYALGSPDKTIKEIVEGATND